MILLDTTFLIDLLRKRKNAYDKAVELEDKERLATTYINIYELLIGVYSKKDLDHEKKLNDIKELMNKLEILTLKGSSTIKSAMIGGELMLKGQIISDTDCMIAGIALSNSIGTIITRNKKHFERIKSLRVEEY